MPLALPTSGSPSAPSESSTVPQAFDTLFKSLSIEAAKPKASRQQHVLRENLQSYLEVESSILTGSYRRGTQIPPLDDIDVLLVLEAARYADYFVDGAEQTAGILRLVQRALREAYPTSEIESHERCIRINFTGTGIGFDVTPAVRLAPDLFAIPDRRLGRWLRTNPKEHERLVSHANQNVCGQRLVPLVKLLKLWNQEHGRLLSGFHIEAMALQALRYAPADAREGAAFLFGGLATAVRQRTPDPWPQGLDADEYLTREKRERAAARLAEAAETARAAVAAERAGDTEAAHWGWSELFGGRYPESGRKPGTPRLLSPYEAAGTVARAGVVSATSLGLTASAAGLASATSGTSHGGPDEPALDADASPATGEAERQIEQVLQQFTGLRRLIPEEAVLNPALWPVFGHEPAALYAVLVGEQRTNLGRRHQVLVAVPAGTPVAEAKVYALGYQPKSGHDGTGRYRTVRGVRHLWGRGALCTHAQCDRWDGQLVTLVIWAAEWLFRQDYYQQHGVWIGPEVAWKGRRRVNRLHGGKRRRGR